LGGVFVGGKSARMGGAPKGLLIAPSGETLVARWITLFSSLSVPAVLVGQNDAYAGTGLESIADATTEIGPLGGLIALLERAGSGFALAVACDMPYVSAPLLAKLAHHPGRAPALAPRDGLRWQPLFARFYAPDAIGPARAHAARGAHSLQTLLDALDAAPFPLDSRERHELRDWDTPDDVRRG
jgi:molybdopterin-guanine dinucleotide biosynthesis protein A